MSTVRIDPTDGPAVNWAMMAQRAGLEPVAQLGQGSDRRDSRHSSQPEHRRAMLTAGQPVTINLGAVDACGDWPAVVGTGASTP